MMPIWESAWKFLEVWPEILKETSALTHPAIFRLTGGHSVRLERLKLTRDLQSRR
jgi:hypothetical protein